MPESSWAALRHRLVEKYDEFVRRLSRRVGSREMARDVIHETYLRFERVGDSEPVRNLDAYIMTTAVNIAKNRTKIDRRYLSASETEILIGIPDEAPDPERTAQARSETELLMKILVELPDRRRQIFEASWVDEVSHAELARLHGVHLRTIQREVAEAALYIRKRWSENLAIDRRASPSKLSLE